MSVHQAFLLNSLIWADGGFYVSFRDFIATLLDESILEDLEHSSN